MYVAFILGRSCWCDVDSLHVFLPSISQPEHAGSGSDWLGYVPPSIVKSGPEYVQVFLSKVFWDQVSSSSTVLLLFYSTVLAPKVPPIETKTLN